MLPLETLGLFVAQNYSRPVPWPGSLNFIELGFVEYRVAPFDTVYPF